MHDPAVFRSMHLARFQAAPAVFAAPGRVNLIGEHTDYAEGFVMPAAIDFATLAGISPRSDGKIVVYSENYGEERSFEAALLPASASKHWSDYPLGVVCNPGRGRPSDSRLQPELVGRRPAGVGAIEFSRR
jgi:galactokinase